MKLNVYKILPTPEYRGYALVAAENEKQANDLIHEFQVQDEFNQYDSNGYCDVRKDDVIPGLYATIAGILDYGIYY